MKFLPEALFAYATSDAWLKGLSGPVVRLFRYLCEAKSRPMSFSGKRHERLALVIGLAIAVVACRDADAQCAPRWLQGDGVPGVNGDGIAAQLVWDPDGSGPQGPKLVVVGSFTVAGNVLANNIAAYDPQTGVWSTFDAGTNGHIVAIAQSPNGGFVIAGGFSRAGNVQVGRLARWNGTTWEAVATSSPPFSDLFGIDCLPNGNVLVYGNAFLPLRTWNGVSWVSLPFQSVTGSVRAVKVMPNGDIIVGGKFTTAGTNPVRNIGRWNGTAWSSYGNGVDDLVTSILLLDNGDLIVQGDFQNASGVPAKRIARWNGTTWSPLGDGLSQLPGPMVIGGPSSLAQLPNGDIVANGQFEFAGNAPAYRLARWDGAAWHGMDTAARQDVLCLSVLPNGTLVAGGWFDTIGPIGASNLGRWTSTGWSRLSNGFNNNVSALLTLPDGNVVAGGWFTHAGTTRANRVALWNGEVWTSLGNGIDGMVSALTAMANGDIIAGGQFTSVGTTITNRIARWNGQEWLPLGSGLNSHVTDLATMPNGDVIACGFFTSAGGISTGSIARWNGSAWSAMPSGPPINVRALKVLSNGTLLAAGVASNAGSVYSWNGSQWIRVGNNLDGTALAITELPDGQVVVGGRLTISGVQNRNIARLFNGQWSALGSGLTEPVNAIISLPNGGLLAGAGEYATFGDTTRRRLAAWDGASWSDLGPGLDAPVDALATDRNGVIFVGGQFLTAGGLTAPYMAQLTYSTDPPSITGQPVSALACPSVAQNFTVSSLGAGITYRWQWRPFGGVVWTDVQNGQNTPMTDDPCDTPFYASGADARFIHVTNSPISACQITPVVVREVRVVLTNACGTVSSDTARWTSCVADFDCSRSVEPQDLFAFLNAWFMSDQQANVDGVNGITPQDIFYLLNAWFVGC